MLCAAVTILLRCPPLSGCLWCVKLYSTVTAGCASLFCLLWVLGHLYVLGQTDDSSLRTQRSALALALASRAQ